MFPGDWNESVDAMLRKVQDSVNAQLARQYEQLVDSLRDFLYDLFNYPLLEDWRRSLARFAEHWADRGLILTQRTLSALEQLIAERIGGSIAVASAEAPASGLTPGAVGTDAVLAMAPATTTAEKADDAVDAAAKRERGLRAVAKTFAAREQQRLRLTDDERVHFEFHIFENLRRQERGWPLLPAPDYWLDKDYEYRQRIAKQPSIRGLTKEEAQQSEKAAKYARYWELTPEEREKLDRETLAEEKRKFEAEHGWLATFFNPAFDGTGTFNDLIMMLSGFGGGAPGLTRRNAPLGPLASPPGRGQRAPVPKTGKASTPRRGGSFGKKPPFPPPASTVRVTTRRGQETPHPSHVLAADSEEKAARFIHTLPYEAVLFWGLKIGAHGADVVSYNLRTKTVTLWDVKWRSEAMRIQPSKTFRKDLDPLKNALDTAARAVRASNLSKQHKDAAIRSIADKTFQTRTLGAGHAKNSTFGERK